MYWWWRNDCPSIGYLVGHHHHHNHNHHHHGDGVEEDGISSDSIYMYVW